MREANIIINENDSAEDKKIKQDAILAFTRASYFNEQAGGIVVEYNGHETVSEIKTKTLAQNFLILGLASNDNKEFAQKFAQLIDSPEWKETYKVMCKAKNQFLAKESFKTNEERIKDWYGYNQIQYLDKLITEVEKMNKGEKTETETPIK